MPRQQSFVSGFAIPNGCLLLTADYLYIAPPMYIVPAMPGG